MVSHTQKKKILSILLIRFNGGHRLTFYCPNFMPICPVTKKNNFVVPVTKTLTFFTAILHLFGPGCLNFVTREILVRLTCMCKILSGSVKVCQSYSRKANFQQIHITLSYAYVLWLMIHHNIVYQRDLGVVGRLMITLLQIYCWLCFERICKIVQHLAKLLGKTWLP